MVTASQNRRSTPEYSLSDVKAAAKAQALDFGGWTVMSDMAAICYSIEQVCRCLGELEEKDFSHAENYANNLTWHDVYKVKRQNDVTGKTHDLYIKFSMKAQRITLVLCSFHPKRGSIES